MKNIEPSEGPELEVLLKYANSIIETLREPFLVLDKTLRVIFPNHAFFKTFKATEKETLGCSLPV